MKKVIALMAAAAFVLSMATMASAAHEGRHTLMTSGMFQTDFVFTDNENFTDEGNDDQAQFEAHQRLRQYFDYQASENLKATVGYEIDALWGGPKAPAGADAGDADETGNEHVNTFLELKRANMQFTIPETETTVKSGLQWIELPSVALGSNPVLAGDMGGVVVSSPVTDVANLTFGWTRGWNNDDAADEAYDHSKTAAPGVDSFFASMPIDQDGFSLSPFAVYTVIGQDYRTGTGDGKYGELNDDASAYWVGSGFDMDMMDPIGVRAGFIYGALDTDQDENEQSGWYADLAVNLKMESMTPEVFAMYASGNDDDSTDGSERMPTVFNDGLTSPYPSMMFGDSTYLGIGGDGNAGVSLLTYNPTGIMAVGATLKDIVLTDKMTGTLTAAFYQGTNDKATADNVGASTFTEEDTAYDITAATNYEIYEQLSAICEVGYAKADFDDSISNNRGNDYRDEPATRVGLGLLYQF